MLLASPPRLQVSLMMSPRLITRVCIPAPSNMVVGNHVWLFVLKWIKSKYKKVNPQLHQLHFKASVASGCHTGRPSSTGLMICSLLSVQGNFLWRAFGQVPSHNFSDSQCDLQAPGPSGTCLALYSAPPCLLPCHHILHSFIPFNLSLSPEYRSLSVHSPAHFRPSSGALHWLSSG